MKRVSLDHIRARMAAGETVILRDMQIDFPMNANRTGWKDCYLSGDHALAALDDPQAAYGRYFAAMDIAFVENRVRKLATGPANSAYRTVVARNLPPLTVAGLVKQVNCPGLPYRLEYNYHLAQTFYDEG